MTHQETNQLIERYLEGNTTPEEEHRLALEVARDDAPEEWKIISAMLGELTTDEAIFDRMMADRKTKVTPLKPIRRIKPWYYIAAAACVILALSVSILLFTKKESDIEPKLIARTTTERIKPSSSKSDGQAHTKDIILKEAEPTEAAETQSVKTDIDVRETETEVKTEEPAVMQDIPQSTETRQTEGDAGPKFFPITNPKRLEYTPEEIEQLRQRAKEKYLEWIELERQIIEMEQKEMAELTDSQDE